MKDLNDTHIDTQNVSQAPLRKPQSNSIAGYNGERIKRKVERNQMNTKSANKTEKKFEKTLGKELRAEAKGVARTKKRLEKYGDPTLTALASHDKSLTKYYAVYIDDRRAASRDRIISMIYFVTSMVFMIMGVVMNELIITVCGGTFLALAMGMSNSAQIELSDAINIGSTIISIASNDAKNKAAKDLGILRGKKCKK